MPLSTPKAVPNRRGSTNELVSEPSTELTTGFCAPTSSAISPRARLVCPQCQRTYPPGTAACAADGSGLVQREDDKPEAVRPRIEIYLEKTVPVLDHYRQGRLVSEIDGLGTIEEISSQVLAAVASAPSNGEVARSAPSADGKKQKT